MQGVNRLLSPKFVASLFIVMVTILFVSQKVAAYTEGIHYTATYALAIAVGFSRADALVIASADQGVDDNDTTVAKVDTTRDGENPSNWLLLHCISRSSDSVRASFFKSYDPEKDPKDPNNPFATSIGATSGSDPRASDVRKRLKTLEANLVKTIKKAKAQPTNKVLWTAALLEMGVFFHCQEDSWSHNGFGGLSQGHAKEGHKPDLPVYAAAKITRAALQEKLVLLSYFRKLKDPKFTALPGLQADVILLVTALRDSRIKGLVDYGGYKPTASTNARLVNSAIVASWLLYVIETKSGLDACPLCSSGPTNDIDGDGTDEIKKTSKAGKILEKITKKYFGLSRSMGVTIPKREPPKFNSGGSPFVLPAGTYMHLTLLDPSEQEHRQLKDYSYRYMAVVASGIQDCPSSGPETEQLPGQTVDFTVNASVDFTGNSSPEQWEYAVVFDKATSLTVTDLYPISTTISTGKRFDEKSRPDVPNLSMSLDITTFLDIMLSDDPCQTLTQGIDDGHIQITAAPVRDLEPPGDLAQLARFDINENTIIDDVEIKEIIRVWIMGGLSDELVKKAVKLWITGANLLTGTVVGPPGPHALFEVSNVKPFVGEEVLFDGSESFDADGGPIVGYVWNFDDGTTTRGVTASHTYETAGTFTVTLTVNRFDGLAASSSKTLRIVEDSQTGNQPPLALFKVSNVKPFVGEKVIFDGSESFDRDGQIVDYLWDFGDSATTKGVTASHIYEKEGTFTVTFTVTDNDGQTDFLNETIIVQAKLSPSPVALFTVSNTEPYLGESIFFDASRSLDPDGNIVDYSWDFGDGTSGKGVTISHVYEKEGDFTVVLNVTDIDGLSDETRTLLNVRNNIEPSPPVITSIDSPDTVVGDSQPVPLKVFFTDSNGDLAKIRFKTVEGPNAGNPPQTSDLSSFQGQTSGTVNLTIFCQISGIEPFPFDVTDEVVLIDSLGLESAPVTYSYTCVPDLLGG